MTGVWRGCWLLVVIFVSLSLCRRFANICEQNQKVAAISGSERYLMRKYAPQFPSLPSNYLYLRSSPSVRRCHVSWTNWALKMEQVSSSETSVTTDRHGVISRKTGIFQNVLHFTTLQRPQAVFCRPVVCDSRSAEGLPIWSSQGSAEEATSNAVQTGTATNVSEEVAASIFRAYREE